MLDHLTGQCAKEQPKMIYMRDGRKARLYGPWLNVEKNCSVKFELDIAEGSVQLTEKKSDELSGPQGA